MPWGGRRSPLRNIKIGSRLVMMGALAVLGMLVVAGFGLAELHHNLLADRKEKTRNLVEVTLDVVERFHAQERAGALSREAAQAQAAAAVSNLRYGVDDKEYFWINDLDGIMVMHPILPELDGTDVRDIEDPNGTRLFREFIRVARTQDHGFVPYLWPKPGSTLPVEKISYVAHYEPWAWVVGSGIYIDDVERIFHGLALLFTAVVSATLAVVGVSIGIISASITRPLLRIRDAMLRLSKGDHSIVVDQGGTSEIGDLKRAMRIFRDNAVEMDRLRDEKAEALVQMAEKRKELERIIGFSRTAVLAWKADRRWTITYASDNFGRLCFPASDGGSVLGSTSRNTFSEMIHADDLERVMGRVTGHFLGRDSELSLEFRVRQGEGPEVGEERWVETHFWANRDSEDEVESYQAVIHDITIRRKREKQLRLASVLFETTNEALMITGADNKIEMVNPAFTRITGYAAREVVGQDPSLLRSGRHDEAFYLEMWKQLKAEGFWEGEIWNRRKNGEVYPEWLSISVLKDEDGNPVQHVAAFSDVTKRKEAEETIIRQANFDALTDLPNRNLFNDRLDRELKRAKRSGQLVGLMFIDLDRFKYVNDTLGHSVGDHLLQQVAARLNHSVRESDTVARLGGDEFTVILPELDSASGVARVAQEVLEALERLYVIDGHEIFISASIGITFYPNDGSTAEILVRNADVSMYRAKEKGRGTFCFYTTDMNIEAQRRHMIEQDLRGALEGDQFWIHYQPYVSAKRGEITGAEALIRWKHPRGETIMPDQFIPVAEDTGLIVPIGLWVLRTVLAQMAAWRRAGKKPISISVNISARQFQEGHLGQQLRALLEETGADPNYLMLELTETLLIRDPSHTLDILHDIKELGVTVALDDFGTGYSSLGYLKQFPIDTLKIDRSFINGIATSKDDDTMVSAIVSMAHSLGVRVIGEGVENRQQLDKVNDHDCDFVQGFHFSRPLPADEFEKFCDEFGVNRN